jgi:hypothetical protein
MKFAASILALLALCVAMPALRAEMPYHGPKPAKKDVPYLIVGDKLIETETLEASQREEKNRTTYVVAGTSSPARTPLAEPAFLINPGQIKPESLTLYPMKVDKGNRTVTFNAKPKKDDPRPVPLLFHQRKDNLMVIEVNQYLDIGEYCLSPDGSNTVFCFQIY